MLENREIMMRLFPDLFARHRVAPVERYPDELLSALRSVAPHSASAEPTVALMTPGVYNSAYYEHSFLADKLGIELVATTDNTVVTHTFSKIHGLAALRVGWMFGPAHIVDACNRIRGPFNVTTPAMLAAVAAPKPAAAAAPAAAIPTGAPTRVLPPVSAPVGLPADLANRPEQRVPMTRLRARIAERLLQSQATNAILTTFNEVNMAPVMELRKKYQERFEKEHGVKLGFMSFFVKAAVHALKKFPILNASVDGNDIVYHGYFDIGIAVGSPRGLVVPILRNADQLSFAEIEKKIADFGKRAAEGKLGIEEMTGGTFSISNGGVFGSMLSTPIINPPQSAILGVHATKERPVVENGQIVIRPINYLAMSYDHRIIDGREAVLGLVAMKEALEDPARLLFNI